MLNPYHYYLIGYIASSNGIFRLAWIALVAISIYYQTSLIIDAQYDFAVNPLKTITLNKDVREVPFPAITVDSGTVINPFGFIIDELNKIAFSCPVIWVDPYTNDQFPDLFVKQNNDTFLTHSKVKMCQEGQNARNYFYWMFEKTQETIEKNMTEDSWPT